MEVFRELYEDLLEQHLSCVSTGTGIYGDYLWGGVNRFCFGVSSGVNCFSLWV